MAEEADDDMTGIIVLISLLRPSYISFAEVIAWLKSLKLEKYAPIFIENEVDFDTLPHLTQGDLEKWVTHPSVLV